MRFQISLMEINDHRQAANVLSVAMQNNPLHISVYQGCGENERLEIEKMFFDLFKNAPGIVFLAEEEGKMIGVLRMKSCVGRKMNQPVGSEDQSDIQWRKSVWFAEWARHDPVSQHWHLGPLGVLPAFRGRGVGSALMRRFCAEVDRCSAAAYLETDREENVRFYEKFGFRKISETTVFNAVSRYMLREALGCSSSDTQGK